MNDNTKNDIDHLSVISFEPTKVQFRINDLDEWRKQDSDHDFTIGSLIKIKDGNEQSIVSQIQSYQMVESTKAPDEPVKNSIIISAEPIGVLKSNDGKQTFSSGIKNISIPPQGVEITSEDDLSAILSHPKSSNSFSFGHYSLNKNIPIYLDGNLFFSHHVAVVGSTGSGKSGTVAKIIQNVVSHRDNPNDTDEADAIDSLNNSHIIIFDIHGEYSHAFPHEQNLTIHADNINDRSTELTIPYWLLNPEELESLFIESGDNNAYNQIAQFKLAVMENKKIWNPEISDVTYDMPIYFSINEVCEYIKNKNSECYYTQKGTNKKIYAVYDEEEVDYKQNNFRYLFQKHNFYSTTGSSKHPDFDSKIESKMNGFYGEFTRFITRLQAKLHDPRLDFLLKEPDQPKLFKNNPVKTFNTLVPSLFGHKNIDSQSTVNSNVTIIDLSVLPFEVVSIIVSVISRLAFDISFHQTKMLGENKTPLMLVYEEAHRYIPKNQLVKYRNTRDAVERIAKEGRKYGISEMIVTQRPSEISSTVLSQCNNFVIMKLTNQDDQNIIKSILPETETSFTNSLSSLNRREALLVGNAMANTSIIKVDDVDPLPQSSDVSVYTEWSNEWRNIVFNEVIKNIMPK